MSEANEYKVELDVYSGPLELLLYLIRREEVDINNIPIATITTQYLHYVELLRRLDINLAGDFLVMAATLMEIKSRMLLPRPVADPTTGEGGGATTLDELADPRYELVQQLLEYKRFKDTADNLYQRRQQEQQRFSRAVPKSTGPAPLDIEDLSLYALIDAFNAIMASIGHTAFGHEVVYDDTPITVYQANILDRLETAGPLTMMMLFAGKTSRSELVGIFIAMLELVRQKKILVDQPELGGDIKIALHDDPDQLAADHRPAEIPTLMPVSPEPTVTAPAIDPLFGNHNATPHDPSAQ